MPIRWKIERDFWDYAGSVAWLLGMRGLYASCHVRMLDAHVKYMTAAANGQS